jgi:type IV secretory pathway VirB6-like protein
MIAIAMSYLPWFVSGLLLKFTLALGPIAVFCLLIPAAKGIFDGWLGVVLSAALAKVMIVMMLVLIGLTEQGTTEHIVAEAGNAGGNVFVQLQALAILGVVCFIAGITAFLLPGVAARICSGIAMSVGAYTGAASKAGSGIIAAASAGASKAASAASSASRAFTSTSRTFVGPNMSGI